jgi:hypothetical protein
MAENVETIVGGKGYHREITVAVDGTIEVAELAVESHRNRGFSQTGADRLRNLEAGDSIGVLDDFSVRVTKL